METCGSLSVHSHSDNELLIKLLGSFYRTDQLQSIKTSKSHDYWILQFSFFCSKFHAVPLYYILLYNTHKKITRYTAQSLLPSTERGLTLSNQSSHLPPPRQTATCETAPNLSLSTPFSQHFLLPSLHRLLRLPFFFIYHPSSVRTSSCCYRHHRHHHPGYYFRFKLIILLRVSIYSHRAPWYSPARNRRTTPTTTSSWLTLRQTRSNH